MAPLSCLPAVLLIRRMKYYNFVFCNALLLFCDIALTGTPWTPGASPGRFYNCSVGKNVSGGFPPRQNSYTDRIPTRYRPYTNFIPAYTDPIPTPHRRYTNPIPAYTDPIPTLYRPVTDLILFLYRPIPTLHRPDTVHDFCLGQSLKGQKQPAWVFTFRVQFNSGGPAWV